MKKSNNTQKLLLILVFTVYWIPHVKSIYHCSTPDEWMGIYNNNNVAAQNVRISRKTWPDGIVKYQLHDSLNESDIVEVHAAFDEYHKKTCIRFQPRNSSDYNYVSIELDDSVCGLAHVCMMRTGYQFVKIGLTCRNKATLVHELGHSLCLGHEHQRADRDDFVTINNHEPNCFDKTNYGKLEESYRFRGFYDYSSQMHYECGSGRCVNSKNKFITKCGEQTTVGLSILDADYLNQLYQCRGCFGHRWVNRRNIKLEDKKSMFSFGYYELTRWPLYPCRAFKNGHLLVGKASSQENSPGISHCLVPYNNEEFVESNFEVLTIPGGLREGNRMYKLVKVDERWDKTKLDKIFERAVVGGHLNGADGTGEKNVYIGFVPDVDVRTRCSGRGYSETNPHFQQTKGKITVIGSVKRYADRYESHFPLCGSFHAQTYYVLSCQEGSSDEDTQIEESSESNESEDITSANLPVKYSTSLSPLYETISSIVIFGRVKPDASKFIVDLMDNARRGNIALRFNTNLAAKMVLLNSYSIRSGWGVEEGGSSRENFQFQPGQQFKLEIRCRKGKFRFYANNIYLGRYAYYQPLGKVNFMRILGDVEDIYVVSQ